MSLLLLSRLWKVLMKDNDDGTEFVSLPKKFIYAVLHTRQMGVLSLRKDSQMNLFGLPALLNNLK